MANTNLTSTKSIAAILALAVALAACAAALSKSNDSPASDPPAGMGCGWDPASPVGAYLGGFEEKEPC
jgi:hypothetical protein